MEMPGFCMQMLKAGQMPVLSYLIQMESLLAGGLTAMTRMWKLG